MDVSIRQHQAVYLPTYLHTIMIIGNTKLVPHKVVDLDMDVCMSGVMNDSTSR